jgi:uncharacterized protein DUF3168
VRRSPVEHVIGAVVTTLRASTGLTALIGSTTAVYNHVDQGASMPYVVVSAPSDRRMDTAVFGAETLVNVQVCSQYKGDKEATQVYDQCLRALQPTGSPFTVLQTSQHTALGCAWDNSERYSETINGVQTRYHVGIFRVWTEQSST